MPPQNTVTCAVRIRQTEIGFSVRWGIRFLTDTHVTPRVSVLM